MPKKEDMKTSPLAIIGFIFSLLFFIPVVPFIGAILGIIALVKISGNNKLKGKGLAIAALIIGLFMTVLQVFIIIAVSTLITLFFSGFITAVEKGPIEGMNICLEKDPSPMRDMCIFMVISTNINQTELFDENICDDYVQTPDFQMQCNALLKKDPTYCESLSNPSSRIQCFGLIEEIKNSNS